MSNAIRKRISKKITKALHDFNLIEDGDKVLIAVSGGKDSSVLLMELASRMGKFLPNCEIGAIHIQSDFADKAPREFLQRMAEQYPQIPFFFKDVAIKNNDHLISLCIEVVIRILFLFFCKGSKIEGLFAQ